MKIEFRCWYCNRKHTMPLKGIGKTIRCSCSNELRVPRYSGGKCRVKTMADWAVEAVVYGGGGAFLCGGIGFLLAAVIIDVGRDASSFILGWGITIGLAAIGFLIGLLFGERGINWIGRLIRKVDSDQW